MSTNETVSSMKRKRMITELVEGQNYASQLKSLMLQNKSQLSLSAKELIANVLRSFDHTLAVLTSSSTIGCGEDGSPVAVFSGNDIPKNDDYSGDSVKKPTKDRRGSYKRRKTEETWSKVSETSEDIHAWRKYGQKEILNSPFPRSYFRCTRKYEQGCKATKQVQRIQQNPDTYQITYIGFHTCKQNLKAPQMLTNNTTTYSDEEEFSKVQNDELLQDPQIIKQEYQNDDAPVSSDLTDNLDPTLWSDLKDFCADLIPL